MKIIILPLSQRDNRWKDQRLGTVNGTTIGSHGCLITCMSMLAQYYGHFILPNQMDDWLTVNQGYIQGNLYRNDAFSREFIDCSYEKTIYCTNTPAPLNEIDEYLKIGKPVIAMVDFDHDPKNGVQTHFILIIGKTDDGHYIANDPWDGIEIFIDARYGDTAVAINQLSFFSGPITQGSPCKVLEAQISAVKDIVWGKGWVWDRMNKLKKLLPK